MREEALDPEDIRAEALDTAATRGHSFQGKRLEPFSFARQTAAQRLDMGTDSPLESAVLLVYLCTLGEDTLDGTSETGIDRIDSARGAAGVRRFRRAMNAWADANKISFGSAAAKEAREVANAIWLDLSKSETVPDAPKSGGRTAKKSKP